MIIPLSKEATAPTSAQVPPEGGSCQLCRSRLRVVVRVEPKADGQPTTYLRLRWVRPGTGSEELGVTMGPSARKIVELNIRHFRALPGRRTTRPSGQRLNGRLRSRS